MDGTRHERAAIVISSYVIGFVTAFILYATVEKTGALDNTFMSLPATNTATVIESVSTSELMEIDSSTSESVPAVVTYKDGLLDVTALAGERILSINHGVDEDSPKTLANGSHYGELYYTISADNKFVFFCEKHEVESETCTGYVYDVATDQIYGIKKNGSTVPITVKSASETIWTAVGLKIGSHYSADLTTPWIMVAN